MLRKCTIPFAQPYIGSSEIKGVKHCLRSGWLTTGSRSFEFEKKIGDYIGSKYNIATSSCTAALHLALKAVGIGPGDEVIISPITFVSAVNAIEYCSGTAVFADVEEDTLNLDIDSIKNAITCRTKAIIVTHYGGHACNLEAINELAKQYNLYVIEDAAHAFGAEYKGKKIGDSNNLVCFSFYATKNITCGEGGMISTNNPDWIERIKELRLHGMTNDAWNRYSISGSPLYDVNEVGFKYNLTDIAATIGLEQLKKSEQFLKKRAKIVHQYRHGIKERAINCRPLAQKTYAKSSNYLFTIILNEKADRTRVIADLKAARICTSILFTPVYKFTCYRKKYILAEKTCPICESLYSRLISLPIFVGLRSGQVNYVLNMLQKVLQ